MNKDKMGMILSAACLVHCILVPVVLPVLPLFGLTVEHEAMVHVILGLLVTVVAGLTIVPGYLRHGEFLILLIGILGVVLIIVSCIVEVTGGSAGLYTILGSYALISAHYNNHKVLCMCRHHSDTK